MRCCLGSNLLPHPALLKTTLLTGGDNAKVHPSPAAHGHLVGDHAHGVVDLKALQSGRLQQCSAFCGLLA
jgi:hypothetical protein